MKQKTQKLVLSGIMIAQAMIFSFITVYKLPYGGSITLLSMLPIILVGYIYGTGCGVLTGLVYGVLQGILGAATSSAFAGLELGSVLLVCLLDYLVAFGVLGLGGILKKRIASVPVAIGIGAFVATTLRFAAHVLSGYIVYGSYAQWFFGQPEVSYGQSILNAYSGNALAWVYSLIYNATYMVPEIILTVVGAVVITNIPQIKRICKNGSL